MTLKQIIGTLNNLALAHPNVNSVYEGNVYECLNANPSNKYASVVVTQTTHTQDDIFDHYGFVIFYVDRLVDDIDENRLQIQSIGKTMLSNIVDAFCYEFDAEHNDITFHPFTQKFADETAGVYIDIVIDTPKEAVCPEFYWNGVKPIDSPSITIKNQTKQLQILENGHYEITYDSSIYTGLDKVIIDVEIQGGGDCPDCPDCDELTELIVRENGVYEGAFNRVDVYIDDTNGSYDDGYNQGYKDGQANNEIKEYTTFVLRAKLKSVMPLDKSKIIHFDEYGTYPSDTITFKEWDSVGWRGDFMTILSKHYAKRLMLKEGLFYELENVYELEIYCDTIDENAFNGCVNLTELDIPYVLTIRENAFKDCTNLKEINLNAVQHIATGAFDGCSSLTKIVCKSPSKSLKLGSNTFNGAPENGTLYLGKNADENVWLEKLPNGWTVERL